MIAWLVNLTGRQKRATSLEWRDATYKRVVVTQHDSPREIPALIEKEMADSFDRKHVRIVGIERLHLAYVEEKRPT